MTFENFTNIIAKEMENKLKENESCKVRRILKNNGIWLTGIYFIQEEVNISPTVYMDAFYEEYCQNKISIEETVNTIYKIYEDQKFSKGVDLRDFFEFEKIKDRIIYRLVNYERNKEFLKDVPHIEYLDLAMYYMVLVSDEKEGSATITVSNSHKELWNISDEELFNTAMKNTPELRKIELVSMKEILCEMAMERGEEIHSMIEEIDFITPMYVLTNRIRNAGAASILYPDALTHFSDSLGEKDFYVIPSSVNEVILIPILEGMDSQVIINMIKDINEHEIPSEEVLSDSLYIYRRELDDLEIVEETI